MECLLPRKRGFSECMGALLANPCHPYIQRDYRPFVICVSSYLVHRSAANYIHAAKSTSNMDLPLRCPHVHTRSRAENKARRAYASPASWPGPGKLRAGVPERGGIPERSPPYTVLLPDRKTYAHCYCLVL